MYEYVQYASDNGIATITLDRPEVYNAFNYEMIIEINDALRRSSSADEVYAIVLTGAGDGFCSGADVSEMPDWDDQAPEDYAAHLWAVQHVVRQLRAMATPSVAAVNGPAIGAGADFALACDARFLADDAYLREGFVRIGLVPGDSGAWLLPRLIGEAKAKEYLLTGKDITASAAVDIGLAVDQTDTPLAAATEFARELRDLPATAVQHTKRLIDPEQSFNDYCGRAVDYQWDCVNDPEHKEAITAFNEDRDPDYDRDYEQ
jgi:2-(1,2-epoxy-1,2-dihydrophenyl)acetyl-CoA isomerase